VVVIEDEWVDSLRADFPGTKRAGSVAAYPLLVRDLRPTIGSQEVVNPFPFQQVRTLGHPIADHPGAEQSQGTQGAASREVDFKDMWSQRDALVLLSCRRIGHEPSHGQEGFAVVIKEQLKASDSSAQNHYRL
jgi:hypothetical protein